MKKRWWVLLLAAALLVSLCFPFLKLYTHHELNAELAAAIPANLSGYQVAFQGAGALPVDQLPALAVLDMRGWTLILGAALAVIAMALCMVEKRGARYIAAVAGVGSFLVLLSETFHLQSLSDSLLFQLLLSVETAAWFPVVIAFVIAAVAVLFAIKEETLQLSDTTWRKLSGALSLLAALCLFLPVLVTGAPDGFMDDAASVAATRRSQSMLSAAMADDTILSAIASEEGVFADVMTGGMASLEPLSRDASNIKGIFTIKSSTTTMNTTVLLAAALLLIGAILAFLPKVDRWFPLCISTLGAVILCVTLPSLLSIGSADIYGTATRQLAYIGLGHVTLVPALMALIALVSAAMAVQGLRCADSPYFVNPVPQSSRLRVVALALAVASVVLMLLPSVTFSFYRPGMTRVQCTVEMSGLDALTVHTPETLTAPTDNKGKPMYSAETKNSDFTDVSVAATMNGLSARFRYSTLVALVLTIAGIVSLVLKQNKRIPIGLFLAATIVRIATWLMVSTGMPRALGAASGTAMLYITIPLLLFAAFFANFAHLKEMPKKYRLFLMMLPFLVAVFLFSYMPLYGWSYAFYNYKFGIPMSDQEFVGLKWFTELFSNGGHLNNIVRVMKNTFAMSGLGILTSWMPMFFAILLNEVSHTRFKKMVQVFTTLPNFISWALVFSFAMAMFSMETGIFSKFMLGIGAIDQPVAWLNSDQHIWLKMWGWGTWKGLGWGAIMYLAAIAGIDQELYEAARVDGAGRWKQMRYITLPGLLPTFFVLLLLSISNIINNGMDQYLVFQNSMNKNTIEVLDLYIYNITIASSSSSMYSFGTAIGILKTLFSVTLLFLANFASKKLRGESIV